MFDKISEIFKDGLWNKNPGLVQLLGLCPLLAVTSTAANALGLGIATIAVLTVSNLLISAVRRLLKAEVRIIIYVIIIASVVTCVQLCMQAYTAELYEALGLYISLIVTNCIIIARAEIFASRNSMFYSALDGFANGLGFTAVLLFIGGVREIIGKGTLFSGMDQLIGESGRNLQINLFSADDGLLIAILPPGAFITLGLLVAAKNYLDNRLYIKNSSKKRDSESTIVTE
ncbi:electron transport complex protein RnfE [Ruminobacter amylophilus]|uniref:Ion-translocating oxidoreductase complex subunit E n=1 Tax=Ruminobacter amylophilus TaxID=867 RepID=A0A662ZGW8_9GAMM|nr:electron transport complex subunit E [Ruminobacter amylophilus]SFP33361.1 electron transport complex protein RnfE [Ruminobacter amylophilus]